MNSKLKLFLLLQTSIRLNTEEDKEFWKEAIQQG